MTTVLDNRENWQHPLPFTATIAHPPVMSSSLRKIRILTLDGGGVRGLSSLLILREFIERLQHTRASGTPNVQPAPLPPCDVFDFIVGTGTGGISALFLGRLHMTVDQAIDAYLRMARTAFKSPAFRLRWGSRTAFDGNALADCLRGTVAEYLRDPNALLFETSDPQCRVAVLAATSAYTDTPPYVFRNDLATPSFRIVDVALATSAMTGLFPAVSLSHPPIEFIDAGIAGFNNPSEVALSQAHGIWPNRDTVILSIGTGSQRVVDATGRDHWRKLADLSQRLIESCEVVHDHLVRNQPLLSYFRFSVDRGLDEVGVREWKEAGDCGHLTGITGAYLRKAEPARLLDLCVQAVTSVDGDTLGVWSLNLDLRLIDQSIRSPGGFQWPINSQQ